MALDRCHSTVVLTMILLNIPYAIAAGKYVIRKSGFVVLLTPLTCIAFSSLRVCALSNRNRWLSGVVALLSLVPVAINAVS